MEKCHHTGEPACDQGGHVPTLNFEKNTLPRYLSSQTLNILQNSHSVVSPSWPLWFGSSLLLLLLFASLHLLMAIIFLLLICRTKLFFIFNCLPITHQPFTLLQPRGSPPPLFLLFTFAFYFFKYLLFF